VLNVYTHNYESIEGRKKDMFEIPLQRDDQPTYDPLMVQPFREEVTRLGIVELKTPEEVDAELSKPGLSLVFTNSVCGCAAGMARPALQMFVENGDLPDRMFSVFAGMEKRAVAKAREYFAPFPPSSPQFAILRDGKLVGVIERRHIEGRSPEVIANALIRAVHDLKAKPAEEAK
jgi:putative YphP/YqiW family bacilliredoxin